MPFRLEFLRPSRSRNRKLKNRKPDRNRKPKLEPEPRCQFDEVALIAKCGRPFQTTAKGAIILNESYFVQRFCLEHEVIFERDENWFYAYRTATGAWHKVTPEAIKEMFRLDWEEMVQEFAEPRLATKDSNRFINGVVDGIKSHAGKHGAFPRLKNTIHCDNGMLTRFQTIFNRRPCIYQTSTAR